MIRINLLGVSRPVARAAAGPSEGMAPEAMFIPGALFVILFFIAAFVYWYWNRDITRLNQALVQQQNEQKRLAGITEQFKLYEQRRNQLQLRINTIHGLQNSRVGPVELMRALGNLANRSNELYLITVSTKAERLAVDGQANSVEAIANFIGALQRSGTFDDVQLRQTYEDDQAKHFSFKFNLDCIYKQPASGASPVPATQPVTTTAPATRRAG